MSYKTEINKIIGSTLIVFLLIGCGGPPAEPAEAPEPDSPTAVPETEVPAQPTEAPTQEPAASAPPAPVSLEFQSDAWADSDPIPEKYSCNGQDISPPLSWGDPPAGTQSFVLIMDDPDAESVAGYVWDHWLLFNIPAETRSLPEDIPSEGELADGSRHGINSFGTLAYGGPCPPFDSHGYRFRFYALDILLDLEPGATKDEIFQAQQGHELDNVEIIWYYPDN